SKRGSKKLASAKQEIRKLGKKLPFIPQDVMSGVRRATLAPVIQVTVVEAAVAEKSEKKEAVEKASESAGGATASIPGERRNAFVQPVSKKERTERAFDFYRLKTDQPLVDLNSPDVEQETGADQENAENE